MITYLRKNPAVLYITCVLLFIPAYFINLGLMPLLADEPTRALVAIEMFFSDNYWVPTTNGDFYYKKPPVFNWIIASLFKLTGSYSELVIRIPSVVPLFFYGFTIYLWVKKYLGTKTAFLSAVMFVTCGRLILYASLLGHIDVLYSWVTFMGFMAIWEYYQKEKWLLLFVISYFLSAAAFLMKGLPTILFQGITLTVFFFYQKQFKKLFTWQHLAGILTFLLLVGGYFLKYSQYNELTGWVVELWDQSGQRTPLDKKWHESILHLFTFPFEQVGHLAPWSLLVVFCFRKGFIKEVRNNPFLLFLVVTFIANIPVYWVSPGALPRYMFMLYPLLFIVIAYAYFEGREKMPSLSKWIENILLGAAITTTLAIWIVPFIDFEVSYKIVKINILFIALTFCIWLYIKLKEYRFLMLTIILLFLRIGFDWFVLPHRYQFAPETTYKNDALRVGQQTLENDLTLHRPTPINHASSYYIETVREKPLTFSAEWSEYILHNSKVQPTTVCTLKDSMHIEYEKMVLYLSHCPK